MGQRKEKLEFWTSEVGAICIREEGVQEMCVRGPLGTGAGRNCKSLREQPLRGGTELSGDSGAFPLLRDPGASIS